MYIGCVVFTVLLFFIYFYFYFIFFNVGIFYITVCAALLHCAAFELSTCRSQVRLANPSATKPLNPLMPEFYFQGKTWLVLLLRTSGD